jgi:hypothetical protein
MQPNEIAEVLNRPFSQELLACDVARLAYVAKDGTPQCPDRVHLERRGDRHVHCFETTLPSAIEELVRQQQERQRD